MPQSPDTKRLPVYLTPAELQTVRIAAAYEGKSMAAFAKEQLLTAAQQIIASKTTPPRPS